MILMKLEQIKSWVLTGLVLLSIILFWNLVTFQENYDTINSPEYVNDIIIAQKKEPRHLFVPNKIIYRQNENNLVGTANMQYIEPLMAEIRKWELYDFQVSGNEFRDLFINKPYIPSINLQFPDDMPTELISQIFTLDESNDVPIGLFNNMYIFPETFQDGDGAVYFATADMGTIIKARVRYQLFSDFQQAFLKFLDESYTYLAIKQDSGSNLYLPLDGLILRDYQYYPRNYDVENFKNALFTDPSIVTFNGNQYQDTSSLMKVYENGLLSYVDPTINLSYMSIYDLANSSVVYINEHYGWTDRYYYSESNQTENEITYQLYLNDYPVFNKDGYSKIKLILGNQGVYSYDRPYFSLDIAINASSKEYQLSTGQQVIDYLGQLEDLDINQVEDIMIGYELTKTYSEQLIQLEPSWFYKKRGRWIRMADEQIRGDENGLE